MSAGSVGRIHCDCTNITIMQLFYELKQQYPSISDQLALSCLSDHSNHLQPSSCRDKLENELRKQPRTTAYPSKLMRHRMNTDIVPTRTHHENYGKTKIQNDIIESCTPLSGCTSQNVGLERRKNLRKDGKENLSEFSTPLNSCIPLNTGIGKSKLVEKQKNDADSEYSTVTNCTPLNIGGERKKLVETRKNYEKNDNSEFSTLNTSGEKIKKRNKTNTAIVSRKKENFTEKRNSPIENGIIEFPTFSSPKERRNSKSNSLVKESLRGTNENYINSEEEHENIEFSTPERERSNSLNRKVDSGFSSATNSPIAKEKLRELRNTKRDSGFSSALNSPTINETNFCLQNSPTGQKDRNLNIQEYPSTTIEEKIEKFYPISRSRKQKIENLTNSELRRRPWSIHQEQNLKPQDFDVTFDSFEKNSVSKSIKHFNRKDNLVERKPPRPVSENFSDRTSVITDSGCFGNQKSVRPSAFPVPLLKNSDCEKKPPISPSSIKRLIKNSLTKSKNIESEQYKSHSAYQSNFSAFSNELNSPKTKINIEDNLSHREFKSYNHQEYYSQNSSKIEERISQNEYNTNFARHPQSPKNQRKTEEVFGAIKKISSPTKVLPTLEEETRSTNQNSFEEESFRSTNYQNRPSTLDLKPNDILSVNVNCSVDVVTTPPRKQTTLNIIPELSWCQDTVSPRSFTSVNLTLRTPTSEPQAPIDICSANSSLTYSTSSFNSKQGLQSRLQITVGPSGIGNVTSVRSRPRSSFIQREEEDMVQNKAGSMPDPNDAVVQTTSDTKVQLLNLQLQRKEQLERELEAGKIHRDVIQKEVDALRLQITVEDKTTLMKHIAHLQTQCNMLAKDVDRQAEPRVPLDEHNNDFFCNMDRSSTHSEGSQVQPVEPEDPDRWPCHMCTFRNHPLLNKCEQCEMPRILLVSAVPGDNIHIRFSPGNTRRVIHSWVV